MRILCNGGAADGVCGVVAPDAGYLLLPFEAGKDWEGLRVRRSTGGFVTGGAGGGGRDLEFICLDVSDTAGDDLIGLLGKGVGGIETRDVGWVVIAVGNTVRISGICCLADAIVRLACDECNEGGCLGT